MDTEQINREMQRMQLESNGSVNEIKLGPGIYFTDYRKAPSDGDNKCKIQLENTKSKGRELSNNPEVLIADFKETQNRIEKLKYSIEEIEAYEGYEKDQEFLNAIDEDYGLITKSYQEQIKLLEQLEKVDSKNSLLQTHNVKDIQGKLQENTDKHNDFQAKYFNKASVFI